MPLLRRSVMSLERRLPLVMTGVLLAILGTALFATNRVITANAQNAARGRLARAVQEIASSVEQAVELRAAQLRAAAEAPAMHALLRGSPPSDEELEAAEPEVAPLIRGTGGATPTILWNARGQVVARWGGEMPAGLPSAPRRPLQPSQELPSGVPWVTPLLVTGGRTYFWAAIEFRDELGRRRGTLGTLRLVGGPRDVAQTLRELTGEDVTMYLRNADSDQEWISMDGSPVPAATFAPPSVDEGFARRPNVGRVLVVERAIAGTSWSGILETPVESVLRNVVRTTKRLALLCLLLAVVGGLLTWRIARGVAGPVRMLTHAADALARGESAPAAEVDRQDELGTLARSFHDMAREVSESRRELERRIDEAERANRAKSDFLAMMSHELRTPLNAISGYAQLLEMEVHGTVTPDQRDALIRIQNSQKHLLHLIDDVLSFARIDAGRVDYALAEVPIAASIDAVISMVMPQARAKQISMVTSCPDESLTAYADREKLDQVLLNLVANAVKFTPAEGRVEVTAEPRPDRTAGGRELVEIRVSDTGPGIPARHHESVFEPFTQGDRALNRPREGVGLGLAISRELVQGMGGHISIASPEGAGATFTVTLFRRAPADATPPDGAMPRAELPPLTPAPGTSTV